MPLWHVAWLNSANAVGAQVSSIGMAVCMLLGKQQYIFCQYPSTGNQLDFARTDGQHVGLAGLISRLVHLLEPILHGSYLTLPSPGLRGEKLDGHTRCSPLVRVSTEDVSRSACTGPQGMHAHLQGGLAWWNELGFMPSFGWH